MLTEHGVTKLAAVTELFEYCIIKAAELVSTRISKGPPTAYEDKKLIGSIASQIFHTLTQHNMVEELTDADRDNRNGSGNPVHAPERPCQPASAPNTPPYQVHGQEDISDDY